MAMCAVAMASAVLVGGAALPLPLEPRVLAAGQIEVPAGETGTCFEAPATAPSTALTAGAGTLCIDGHDFHVTLEVTGLTPGEEYAGSLRYTPPPAPCPLTAPERDCQPVYDPRDHPTTLVRHIDDSIAPSSGVLSVQKHISDVRFVSGGAVTLEMVKLRVQADPLAEAIFILP